MSFTLTHDDVSPALSRLAATARNPIKVFRAMGNKFKAITEGTFNSAGASFRPTPWAPKRDGTPSNLQMSTTLSKAFHLEVTASYAKLSNATIYAAIHQFGGVIRPKGKALVWTDANGQKHFAKKVTIPARPFFPVVAGQLTAAAAKLIAAAGERAIARDAAGIA